MGRPSNQIERRRDLAKAFERALARHGLGGATIAAVADEAGVAPGLVHHHFTDRTDLVIELIDSLIGRFRNSLPEPSDLIAYVDTALALRPSAGRTAAKAWVGLFAEAIASKPVADVLQRTLQRELRAIESNLLEAGVSSSEARTTAAGILSCILGCLLFGALMPGVAAGFAAPFVKSIVRDQLER
jgi:TetR/AcrR family transcriptional regulator, transcriptional repressor of bet genes